MLAGVSRARCHSWRRAGRKKQRFVPRQKRVGNDAGKLNKRRDDVKHSNTVTLVLLLSPCFFLLQRGFFLAPIVLYTTT